MGMLNSTCHYALRLVLHVAGATPGERISTRRAAGELDIPFTFLAKVVQGLVAAGILDSRRGATGGVALARDASRITLLQVVEAAGGDSVFHDCVLGLPHCTDRAPCPLHEAWRPERARLSALFATTTLADLAGGRADATAARAAGRGAVRRGAAKGARPRPRKEGGR